MRGRDEGRSDGRVRRGRDRCVAQQTRCRRRGEGRGGASGAPLAERNEARAVVVERREEVREVLRRAREAVELPHELLQLRLAQARLARRGGVDSLVRLAQPQGAVAQQADEDVLERLGVPVRWGRGRRRWYRRQWRWCMW